MIKPTKKIRAYWYPADYNVGDTLTPHLLHFFRPDIELERVAAETSRKLVGVGSIMRVIKAQDVIWGSGVMRESDRFPQSSLCSFLAVRGRLSREILMRDGGKVPEVYGDPGLLLPRVYLPQVEKKYRVGVVPHYVDKQAARAKFASNPEALIIDVALPWQQFIDQVLSCETIISSSLHGIVIAEAYGIPAEWVEYSNKVIGKGFKFRDYLTGTGRSPQGVGKFPPIADLEQIQDKLIHSIHGDIHSLAQ